MTIKGTLEVRIHCSNAPGTSVGEWTDLRIGIQKDKDVINDVPAEGDITFTAPIMTDASGTASVKFGGPFAHGKPIERFIYLCWGQRVDGTWSPIGRIKVHLKHLRPNEVIDALNGGVPIEFSVNLTQPNGKLICGSVNLHG